MHSFFQNLGIKTPEAVAALSSEMRKAAYGEYGMFDMREGGIYKTAAQVQPQYGIQKDAAGAIQKDATNQIGMVTSLGLLGVPLEVPAKLIFPSPTLLINRIPRETVGGATVTIRKITAINSTNVWPSVAEASDSTTGRNTRIARTEANVVFTFKSFEMEDMITPEAIFGSNSRVTPGQDFQAEDVARLTLLLSTKVAEEKMALGGNIAALGNVVGITKTGITQQATGVGTLVALTAYNIQVTALTLQGQLSASVGGDAAGVLGETGAAAATVISTAAGAAPGDTTLNITWTAVRGAVAYNVYVLTGGAAKWQQTVYTNYAAINATGTGAVVNATDKTPNALDYDGLIAQSTKAAFGPGYYLSLPVTATGAATLTGDGTGGVNEFDVAFKDFFDLYKTGPGEIFVNTSQKKKIDQVSVGSSAPVYRIDATAGDLNIKGSLGVRSVMNRYTGSDVPVTVHPFLPPGTILFTTYNLGPYYTQSNVGEVLKMFLGWDYRSVTFGMVKRAFEIGIDYSGVLACYAPFAQGAIQGVA